MALVLCVVVLEGRESDCMSFDLNECSQICHQCVKSYIKKHKLKKGDEFKVLGCTGIPKEYVPPDILASLGEDPETIQSMLDPVMWAAKWLDWHCIDPEGKHWKRKHEEGTLGGLPKYNEARAKAGKSIFHRPYQEAMLKCTSSRKLFRIGRQAGKSETLCVSILFHIFTHENFHVEIIAPYQSQIDLIFKRLTELIHGNTTLQNSVSRSVKAPQYTIELKNGSMVIGFTAGTSSKQEAGASRGQHANMLVFDEADYLSPGDIDAALAVIINFPDATVWMSSTPTGKREKFFESSLNPQYKEFHYPSSVNPNWTKELEAFFRVELTADGYIHEIEADFGGQEEGVYQLKYVEAAQSEWEYASMRPDPKWTYVIGVDWNDVKIGTTIAVVGYNPADNTFYLVDKYIISRAERTQLSACQKISECNRLWNASHIYVDQGFGTTQIEVLHDFGARSLMTHGPNHPDSRLRNIVKGYDSGSSIEIRDLFTKQPIKKPAKPFMVENSVRRFESLSFKYPKSDKSFTEQLQGYIIDRVSMTGRPIYKAQNETVGDHFLDAVNLALVAFALEKTKFGKPSYVPFVAMAGRFGDAVKTNNYETNFLTEAHKHKPQGNRTAILQEDDRIVKSEAGDLPAANTSQESSVKAWRWDDFLKDGPRPETRSLRQAFSDARSRVGLKRRSGNRPQRKKF